MAHLIDKSALVAEIERLREQDYPCDTFEESTGYYNALDEIATFLNTLEVKEVDLDKERIKECPFKKVGCEIYEGHILECKGACSWIVDYQKSKELKAQKK